MSDKDVDDELERSITRKACDMDEFKFKVAPSSSNKV